MLWVAILQGRAAVTHFGGTRIIIACLSAWTSELVLQAVQRNQLDVLVSILSRESFEPSGGGLVAPVHDQARKFLAQLLNRR